MKTIQLSKNVVFILLFYLIFAGVCLADNPIAQKTFISITDDVIDALDDVEATFSSDTTKRDANRSLNQLSARLKKYDRYVEGKWPEGSQRNIVENLSRASFGYQIYYTTRGTSTESKKDAEDAGVRARNLFKKYKGLK